MWKAKGQVVTDFGLQSHSVPEQGKTGGQCAAELREGWVMQALTPEV